MKKGELFEREVAVRLNNLGYEVYRRPKVRYRSQDMFGGDVLWVLDREVVVIQCKKGDEIRSVRYRGRRELRRNLEKPNGVRRYVVVCCGRSRNQYVVQYGIEAEREGIELGLAFERSGVECIYECVEKKKARC